MEAHMPVNGYFDTIFAQSGDVTTVPDAAQPSGAVSYSGGFTAPYSLAPDNPSALLVPRTSFNQIIQDITAAIQNWQQNGIPPFITSTMNGGSPFSYAQYAIVFESGTAYQSLIPNNTDTPPSANWSVLSVASGGVGFSTGDAKLTWKTSADSGWVLMNDGTIGSASSGATYANANASALYELWWDNISNSYAPVTGGRGISGVADFLANKPMGMPLVLGRAMAIAGSGAGLTARTLGQTLGDENLQTHNHGTTDGGHAHADQGGGNFISSGGSGANVTTGGGVFQEFANTASATTGITINNAGTGSAGNMQPSGFMNIMVKL